MPHKHAWTVTQYILLTLPDRTGCADRSTVWACPCGVWVNAHGTVQVGTPLGTPEHWQQLLAAEQRRRTPEAWQASHQQRWRLR